MIILSKFLNDTLKDIKTNNIELSNRYHNTLQSLNDTIKNSNQIQDKLIELL